MFELTSRWRDPDHPCPAAADPRARNRMKALVEADFDRRQVIVAATESKT